MIGQMLPHGDRIRLVSATLAHTNEELVAAKKTKVEGAGGRPISLRRNVSEVADQLLHDHGPKVALRRTVLERAGARRARSRRRYQFWLAISEAIELRLKCG